MGRTPEEPAYHHGDLRRVLVDEAVGAIGEAGVGAISLRELARRAGVSHAAPAHHFGDKAGLLSAVAAEGFRLLAEELRLADERTGETLEIGRAYIGFAVRRSAYFEVMFRPDLQRRSDPELVEARQAVRDELLRYASGTDAASEDDGLAGAVLWSLVHGVAVLALSGSFPPSLPQDPVDLGGAVLDFVFRAP
jgi:AcrR family transcriptional regulator